MTDDSYQRTRAITETGSSFIVEASAGTGKTRTLVERVLHLVLEAGPDGSPLRMSEIAAITYTEKAAGEMKIRLRQEFEKEAGFSGDRGERARSALRDLEGAAISTFHSFAVALLKDRPIEAGLDPRFTTLDEAEEDLFFQGIWEPWLQRAVLDRHPVLERSLRAGVGLDRIREFANILRRHAHEVRALKLPSPPTPEELRSALRRCMDEAAASTRLILDHGDKLAVKLLQAIEWLRDPDSRLEFPAGFRSCGAAANWSDGRASVARVRALLARANEIRNQLSVSPEQRLIDALIRWLIEDFLAVWEAARRSQAVLGFDDQLHEARNLLMNSPAARREFQRRFKTLLVDEFQDTDPVQLDLVLLLSSSDALVEEPSRLTPKAGRLFIVGDPKQSIYRFRGADIESYMSAASQCGSGTGLERLELTKNFRSVPSILSFVDRAFSGLMKAPEDGNYQPAYLAFGGAGARTAEAEPPSVHILADTDSEGKIIGTGRDFLSLEASRVAALIGQMHDGDGWLIEDPAAGRRGAGSARRRPRYGDIAVLMPVLTRADLLEDELTEAGIPFVLEGGKFYYARSEVSSAISVLVALANPNDPVALYGALRSVFFGLSDEDLLRARVDGHPLDYRQDVPDSSPLSRPYAVLRELHRCRHERTPSENYEMLLMKTGAREVLAARGSQSIANLLKLARTIRSLQRERTFSQVVALLDAMDEEGAAEQESRVLEERSDSVRILSIHKAKGLDFPVVIVAGLGRPRRGRRENFIADPHQSGSFGMKVKCLDRSVTTPGWEQLEETEKKREEAELVRLLYVALTRARDHLVLSAHTSGDREGDASFTRSRLKPFSDLLLDSKLVSERFARFVDVAALDQMQAPAPSKPHAHRGDLRRTYEAECAALDAALARGRSTCLSAPPAEDEGGGDIVRSRAVRLGVAFHEAMESVDFGNPDSVPRLAGEYGIRHGLDRQAVLELRRMLQTTLGSELISRARNALSGGGRVIRELPLVLPADSQSIREQRIDLLFCEEGSWVLVDYKTDEPDPPDQDFRASYCGQIEDYRAALASLGIHVKTAFLLLARTGRSIEM